MKLTPKEKAKELINTFDCVDLTYQNIEPIDVAKELALLCVSELEDLQFEMYGQDKEFTMYFLEVQKHLLKLLL